MILRNLVISSLALVVLSACSMVKYNTLEKVGIHKRDILVANVKDARDAQSDAQEQFKDALERFGSVVQIEETGLKKAYDRLSDEYDDSKDAAEEVSDEIDAVEQVAEDLFKEWGQEIEEYTNVELRKNSKRQLRDTQSRYKDMLVSMQAAERSMQPVLNTFKDNVLYLKHNLNTQAVGSLKSTFATLEGDIGRLIEQMNQSIARSNEFIAEMEPAS